MNTHIISRDPLVSVVMSVFNGEQFLRDAVDSIFSQHFDEIEVIIINDGSTDGTAALLDGYQTKDSRVRVYHQENSGLAVALNRGIEMAAGKYIARMDADDIAMEDRFLRQVNALDQNSELGAIGGQVLLIDAVGKVVGAHFPLALTHREIRQILLQGGCPLVHPATMIRTAALRAVGGYRPVIADAEDYDLWLRMSERFQLANLATAVLKYRRHLGQVSIQRVRVQALSNLVARRAATVRERGNVDPLDHIQKITPLLFDELGISASAQQDAIARGMLNCISSLIDAREYAAADDAISELSRSYDWQQAEHTITTDFHLQSARLHWHQRRRFRSLVCVINAVINRPVTILRPLKPFLRQLGFDLRFEVVVSNIRRALGRRHPR